jgi:hypothetical protein
VKNASAAKARICSMNGFSFHIEKKNFRTMIFCFHSIGSVPRWRVAIGFSLELRGEGDGHLGATD